MQFWKVILGFAIRIWLGFIPNTPRSLYSMAGHYATWPHKLFLINGSRSMESSWGVHHSSMCWNHFEKQIIQVFIVLIKLFRHLNYLDTNLTWAYISGGGLDRTISVLVPTIDALVSRSNAGMLFLKVLHANICFNQLFKYWGTVPPGEWMVWCYILSILSILSNTQIILCKNSFLGYFFFT